MFFRRRFRRPYFSFYPHGYVPYGYYPAGFPTGYGEPV